MLWHVERSHSHRWQRGTCLAAAATDSAVADLFGPSIKVQQQQQLQETYSRQAAAAAMATATGGQHLLRASITRSGMNRDARQCVWVGASLHAMAFTRSKKPNR